MELVGRLRLVIVALPGLFSYLFVWLVSVTVKFDLAEIIAKTFKIIILLPNVVGFMVFMTSNFSKYVSKTAYLWYKLTYRNLQATF